MDQIGGKENLGKEVEDEEEGLLGRRIEKRVEEVKETHPERSNINVKMMPKDVDESPEKEESMKYIKIKEEIIFLLELHLILLFVVRAIHFSLLPPFTSEKMKMSL